MLGNYNSVRSYWLRTVGLANGSGSAQVWSTYFGPQPMTNPFLKWVANLQPAPIMSMVRLIHLRDLQKLRRKGEVIST